MSLAAPIIDPAAPERELDATISIAGVEVTYGVGGSEPVTAVSGARFDEA